MAESVVPAVAGGRRSLGTWRSRSVVRALEDGGRWLLLCALPGAMLSPSMSFGPVHLGLGDALALGGSASWAFAWASARSRSLSYGVAKWPLVALVAGVVSL